MVEKIKTFTLFNNTFYVVKNFLPKKVSKKLLHDINIEIKKPYPKVPKYQTYPNLFEKYKNDKEWKYYFDHLSTIIFKLNPAYSLHSSWANVVKSKTNYFLHKHETDISCVYYLKNKYKEFGTYFNFYDKEFIFPGEENSLLIFNGKLTHSTTMPPVSICKNNPRYTLVTDYIYKN